MKKRKGPCIETKIQLRLRNQDQKSNCSGNGNRNDNDRLVKIFWRSSGDLLAHILKFGFLACFLLIKITPNVISNSTTAIGIASGLSSVKAVDFRFLSFSSMIKTISSA